MINSTMLQHPSVQKKMIEAMVKVSVKGHSVAHIRNKQGQAYIAVRYHMCKDGVKRFEFTNRKGKNLAYTIGRAYTSCGRMVPTMANVLFPIRSKGVVCKLGYNYHFAK
ncbi:MAG: hypothetical protein GWN01_12165 [Nitrosopumilaceae archaeon]|nr:hypothetical protein [Nitrosopumilaceae archaeon]NIU88049.1 hypothetical protein [Nitrosopumilaceae archaeon]NIX62233.1 hypothetical protein [Nitrosopumilaceae archaeon]